MTARRAVLAATAGLALAAVVILGRPRGAALPVALGAAVVLALRARRRQARTPSPVPLVLVALLLASVAQLHVAGGRISGDGVSYYVYTRSLVKDRDLDFTNEYTHYEMIDRADIRVPTRTGLRRSIFSVGPGLFWVPFFLAGEGLARLEALSGRAVDLSGYGPHHVNAVALGSLLYGFLAVVLIHAVLRRHLPADTALLAAVLAWWATFLHWYMVHQPTMSHAVSAAGAALVVWLWDRGRDRADARALALLGLCGGAAMCLRWQNGVLLLLPLWDLVARGRRAPGGWASVLGRGAALGAGVVLGALPQMAAWRTIYGEWLLRDPPHGADFLRLDHPYVLQTLFSSRHGLLSWTPVLWAGYLGYLWLGRHRPRLALPLLPPLLLMTYVNMCSGDWWAGGSFSNRRFDSLLPLFALGLAGALEWARRVLGRHPGAAVGALGAVFVAWNLGALLQVARGEARADRASFPQLLGGTARRVAEHAGSPPTWPASWVFAWRHRLPPGQYDGAVGRYLFYRQNNLGGRIDLGSPAGAALLGEGWSERREHQGREARALLSSARVLAPLDEPEDLELTLVASARPAREVRVVVNGHEAGRAWAAPGWTESRLRLPAPLWRRELNDVVLRAEQGPVWVQALDFVRTAAPEAPRGFEAR